MASLEERASCQWYNNHPANTPGAPPAARPGMAGTLFVVATPIGNLEDITLRALRVLRETTLIAAEDTRRTAKLLAHHGIRTPSISFHEHNQRSRVPHLVARLAAGESIAVVSDAGTPGISDPGLELVQACVAAGIPVDPVPGVSAPLAAVVASGFPMIPLTVYGFVPHRSNDRKRWLALVSGVAHTFTCFESPHRISAALLDAQFILGKRQIVVAREVTKLHQEFLRGTPAEVARRIEAPKGEFTIVVGPLEATDNQAIVATDEDVTRMFGEIAKSSNLGRGVIIVEVARRLGKTRREVFDALERLKHSGE